MPVDVKQFYNPVTTLLESDPQAWDGIRPISRIRKEEKIPISYKKESIYKPVERIKRQFSTLKVPRNLQENLPFASKPKNEPKKHRSTYMAKRAVVLEPEDRRKRGLIQMLSTLRKEKESIREQSQKQRREEKLKQKQREAAAFEDIHKSQKKRKYQQMGLDQARKRRAEGLDA
jgi:ribosome biogenesis protein BMS1